MSSDILGRSFQLSIETLTPLHIGNGTILKRDFDFVSQNGHTYFLNYQRLWEDYWSDDPQDRKYLLEMPPAHLVEYQKINLANTPEYVHYALRGEPALGEIREQIKDVFSQAYLPGTSLKGAIRTALMRTMIEGVHQQPITRGQIGAAIKANVWEQSHADDALDRQYAGKDPNRDLFRALQVADSAGLPTTALELQKLQIVRGLDIDVEAIPPNTKLMADLHIDTHFLNYAVTRLGANKDFAQTMLSVARAVQFTSEDRVQQELAYHRKSGESEAEHFYFELNEKLKAKAFDKNQCLLQVGFATGWRSKTLIGGLPDNSPLLRQIVTEFRLDRGSNKEKNNAKQASESFPKSRHLAYVGSKAALPMGWVLMTFD